MRAEEWVEGEGMPGRGAGPRQRGENGVTAQASIHVEDTELCQDSESHGWENDIICAFTGIFQGSSGG